MTRITLLDGGMGQELVHRSGDKATPLWASQVMLDHPGMVAEIHSDYFNAGAGIATTNTYAIHRDRLKGNNPGARFEDLIAAALAEARHAKQAHGGGQIAGSIGPLVASYRPDLHPTHETAVAAYAEIARLLAGDVDLILCETVASLAHARAVLQGALAANRPVWLSVTVDDEDGGLLRSGEPVSGICAIAADGAAAVLANCSAPEAMQRALGQLGNCGLPFGAYANGFQQITKEFLKTGATVDALANRRDLGPGRYAGHALGWIDQGATIVGGCCEVGPTHIAELARQISAAGHQLNEGKHG